MQIQFPIIKLIFMGFYTTLSLSTGTKSKQLHKVQAEVEDMNTDCQETPAAVLLVTTLVLHTTLLLHATVCFPKFQHSHFQPYLPFYFFSLIIFWNTIKYKNVFIHCINSFKNTITSEAMQMNQACCDVMLSIHHMVPSCAFSFPSLLDHGF